MLFSNSQELYGVSGTTAEVDKDTGEVSMFDKDFASINPAYSANAASNPIGFGLDETEFGAAYRQELPWDSRQLEERGVPLAEPDFIDKLLSKTSGGSYASASAGRASAGSHNFRGGNLGAVAQKRYGLGFTPRGGLDYIKTFR